MQSTAPFHSPSRRAPLDAPRRSEGRAKDAPEPRVQRSPGPMPLQHAAWDRSVAVARRHFTLRSLPMNLAIAGTWATFRGIVKAGQAVDDVLYPAWRAQPVERPVFLFANARSGTTLLHRLMALDDERFAPIKLYQTIFPAVSFNRAFDFLSELDPKYFGNAFHRLSAWTSRTFFGGWKDIHPMGLDQHEEDETFFVYPMHSTTLALLLPYVDELEDTFWLDKLPRAERDAMLDWYEACLKRHLCYAGPDKRLLNKNVFFTPRVRSVHARFPDATFIYLIRHPYESLGSYLDMFHRAWKVHRPEIAHDSKEARALARMAIEQYRYALTCRAHIPASQFLVVSYDELVTSPAATVERIYAHLGLPISDAFRVKLDEATQKQREWKSEHAYTLEQFGLTREEVHRELRDVFEEFGFAP